LASYAKQIFDLAGVVEELNRIDFPEPWKISLDIAGDGPDAEELKRRLKRVEGRVEIFWHGRISREQLFRIYERTHAILLLSSSEGMPIALREAMSRGVVPVVTDIPAHREIITVGKNGFVFPVGDVAECARLCRRLAFSDQYENMSRSAASWTRSQSHDVVAEKYAQLFANGSASFAMSS
jgi:glycosyltransferase involved in cell wall biosynthesis